MNAPSGFLLRPFLIAFPAAGLALGFALAAIGQGAWSGWIWAACAGPVLLVCLERDNAVLALREAIGATDPAAAAEGTVRKLYGESKSRNSVHASDSAASSERDVKLFFGVAALSR